MQYPQIVRAFLISFSLLFSTQSQAILFTIDDNYANDSYLSAGSYNGSFDINALMTANFGSQTYTVDSGFIDFSFADDASDVYYTGSSQTSYYSYSGGGSSSSYDRNYFNPSEQVTATAGGQSSTASADYYSDRTFSHNSSSSHTVSDGYYRDVSCGWWDLFRSCSDWVDTSYTVTDYTSYYNKEYGYAMDASLNLQLDDLGLSDLMMDGIFDFNLDVIGDLLFKDATMTFDISLNDIKPVTNTSVPEPGSLALLSLGLLGLLGFRRRQSV